jgi:hypothetical protein
VNDAELILYLSALHLLAVIVGGGLLWLAMRSGDDGDLDDGRGDGGGGGNDRSWRPPRRPTGGPPLPDAEPVAGRLREHGRLTGLRSRPVRRGPSHSPQRPRVRPRRIPSP